MSIEKQLTTINPSVKDALFRRLLIEDNLGYLRKDNTIIGFEVILDQAQELPGYAVIAIQKHTILAYRSDLNEDPKLILFPSMDKLEDPAFELSNLEVERKVFDNDEFIGRTVQRGLLKDVIKDLIPPYKEVEVPDEMASQMNQAIHEAAFENETQPSEATVQKPDDIPFDDPPVDFEQEPSIPPIEPPIDFDENQFDEQINGTQATEEPDTESVDPIVPKSKQARELRDQTFTSLAQVSDYVVVHFGVNPDLASNVTTAALRSTTDKKTQIDVAVLLFIKVFDENKI